MISVAITRLTTPGLDKYGDPASASTTTTTVMAEAIAPAVATEPNVRGRQGTTVGYTLFLPFGTDVVATDTIVIADASFAGTYTIEGVPQPWVDPFNSVGRGLVVNIVKAVG